MSSVKDLSFHSVMFSRPYRKLQSHTLYRTTGLFLLYVLLGHIYQRENIHCFFSLVMQEGSSQPCVLMAFHQLAALTPYIQRQTQF